MTFLPIVERGLRVAARQRGTYRMRIVVVAVLLGIWFFLSVASLRSGTGVQRAHAIFNAITIVGLGFAMLGGVFLTADCLSEERREGTLGLLFLTDLKGYDVVLGKLVSTSIHALYGLMAGMPLLALPLLTGGMTASEFWRMLLVLTVTLFLSLSVGMGVSALCREARAAIGGTLLAMLIMAGILPVLWWLHTLIPRRFALDWLLWPSPAYAYRYAFDSFYSGYHGAREFWTSIAVMAGLGVMSLAVATILLPVVWQEKGRLGRAENLRSRSHRQRFGSRAFRAARRALLNENPFYWLATRERTMRLQTSLLIFVLIPVWLCFFAAVFSSRSTTQRIGFSVAMLLAYGLHQLLKCWIAMEASRRFSEDRQSGALELLLATPLSVRDIIAAQRKAVWESFRLPLVVLALPNVAMIWLALVPDPLHMGRDKWSFICVQVGGIVLLFLDARALAGVGMWLALTARRHNRAILGTMGRVLGPPWAAVVFMVFLGMAGTGMSGDTVEAFMVLWLIFGAVVSVVNILWGETKLLVDFRHAVAMSHAASAADATVTSIGKMKLSPA